MNIFQRNAEKYEIDISGLNLEERTDLFNSEEELLYEPNFETNRSLFIIYELTDVKQIMKLVKGLNEKSLALFYYRDENALYTLLNKVDFTDKDYRILFFAGDYTNSDYAEKLDHLLKGIVFSFTNIQPMIKNSENLDYLRSARKFLEYVRNFRDNYMFLVGNDLNDTLYGVRNRLANLAKYVYNPGLKEFKERFGDCYKNKPAIVVASGPSLDKNVHQLKDFQDKVLILSCDGSLSTLQRKGIKPDIVGSVERVYRTYEAFYKGREIDKDIVFTGPAVVRPEITEKFESNNFLGLFKDKDIYGNWMDDITLNNKGILWCGTSVAHMLMNFADALGCNPIVLIGQDLAYSLDGISHADSAEVKETIDLSKVTEWVKDYDGNDIPSTVVWKKFLLTFEELVRDSDKTVIDATEGGAYIKGTVVKTLREVLEKYCLENKPNFKELLNCIQVEDSYIEAAREHSCKSVVDAIEMFDGLLRNIEKAQKDNKKSITLIGDGLRTQKQLDSIYDALEYVDNEIVKEIFRRPMLMMLFQYPIHEATKLINGLNTDKFTLESIRYNLAVHRELLSIFEQNTKKMMKVLIDGLSHNSSFFDRIDSYHSTISRLKDEYNYLYKSDYYNIQLD